MVEDPRHLFHNQSTAHPNLWFRDLAR
jgi:hypothetical protein